MKKVLSFFLIFIILTWIYYGESRSFFCLNNGRCVTVWKTYNHVCYIIPGRYYGILKPSSINYIQSSNWSNVDIIWKGNSNDITVYSGDESTQIIHNSPGGIRIFDYKLQKKHNDGLFTSFDGTCLTYNKNLERISLYIEYEYALDKNGKDL